MALSETPADNLNFGTQSTTSGSSFGGTPFPLSSGTPAQINISGNARVHLGDQYSHGVSTTFEPSQTTTTVRPTDSAMVSSATQMIEYSLMVLSSGEDDEDCVYGPQHAQLARDRLLLHRARLLRSIAALEKSSSVTEAVLANVGRSVQSFLEMGDSILVELLTGCVNIAEGLATTLDEVYTTTMRQPKRPYPSLRQMISVVSSNKDTVPSTLDFLKVLADKAILVLLILLRPTLTSDESINLPTTEVTERILIQSALASWNKYSPSIKKLYSSTGSWLSIPWARTKTAANEWLLANATLVAECWQSITEKMSTERDQSLRLRILNHLAYTEMDRRYHAIPLAHTRTLEWLLKNDSYNSSLSQQNFAQWLQASDRANRPLYWIRGKPGSGKSTLMRYLLDNPRTKALGKSWAGEMDFLIVSCFFWNSGTKLQKSQEGLLQTLLYQLLTAGQAFPQHIFRMRWSLLQLDPDIDQPWLISELHHAIFGFVSEHCNRFRILFLIDGLDEYQGTNDQRQSICMLLKELSQHNNVKVCASSRPWNVYKDAFQNTPQLRLEFLTQASISNYIKDHFDANNRYRQWSQEAPEDASRLITDLVSKASGVFLWVRLVVGIVLRGLQDGDNTHDLSHRLSEIPTDLEDLFHQLLSQIEPSYREAASKTFELTLQQSGYDNMVMVHYLIHEHRDIGSSSLTRSLGFQEALQKQDIQERRINAQCMGLLELVPVNIDQMGSLHTVEFLHRTARDFMATEIMYQKLLSWRKSPWNMSIALLEARIRSLQSCEPQNPWMVPPIQLLMVTAIMRQITTDADANAVFALLGAGESHLDKLFDAARRHYARTGHGDGISLFHRLERDQIDFLGLAIDEGAISYVLSKLSTMHRAEIENRKGRPLLDLTLMSRLAKRSAPPIMLVDKLLALGASPNAVWGTSTVWIRYLLNLRESRPPQETIQTYVLITRMLILAGAPKSIWFEDTQETLTLEQVVRGKFSKIEADELLALRKSVRRDGKGNKSRMWFWTSSSAP